MGTRADFYIGRGTEAKWLGSIAWDGYPDGISDDVLKATTESAYIAALKAFAEGRRDWTRPEAGWPWPWDDSGTTDYAYAFDGDRVYGTCPPEPWFDASLPEPDEAEGPAPDFPDMSDVQNVTFGARSGVMLFIG